MDFGIRGKLAVVCASSRGLGRGCAEALAHEGCDVVLNARGKDALEQAADALRGAGVKVTVVAADITTKSGQQSMLEAGAGAQILINNAGGPPPGDWRDWDTPDFQGAIDANMLAPIRLIQGFVPAMMDQGWGRVVNITSAAVKSPVPVLGLSNTARSGLTGFVAGVSRQIASSGVTINNLLPGLHATDRADSLDDQAAKQQEITREQARAQRYATIPARRYGTPEEFGAACAFLCSQHAGFIIGQNILVDGGAFNATI